MQDAVRLNGITTTTHTSPDRLTGFPSSRQVCEEARSNKHFCKCRSGHLESHELIANKKLLEAGSHSPRDLRRSDGVCVIGSFASTTCRVRCEYSFTAHGCVMTRNVFQYQSRVSSEQVNGHVAFCWVENKRKGGQLHMLNVWTILFVNSPQHPFVSG